MIASNNLKREYFKNLSLFEDKVGRMFENLITFKDIIV